MALELLARLVYLFYSNLYLAFPYYHDLVVGHLALQDVITLVVDLLSHEVHDSVNSLLVKVTQIRDIVDKLLLLQHILVVVRRHFVVDSFEKRRKLAPNICKVLPRERLENTSLESFNRARSPKVRQQSDLAKGVARVQMRNFFAIRVITTQAVQFSRGCRLWLLVLILKNLIELVDTAADSLVGHLDVLVILNILILCRRLRFGEVSLIMTVKVATLAALLLFMRIRMMMMFIPWLL